MWMKDWNREKWGADDEVERSPGLTPAGFRGGGLVLNVDPLKDNLRSGPPETNQVVLLHRLLFIGGDTGEASFGGPSAKFRKYRF